MVEQEFEDESQEGAPKFLLATDTERNVDPETQARLEALLQAAGINIAEGINLNAGINLNN